jgi:hypothetical protein
MLAVMTSPPVAEQLERERFQRQLLSSLDAEGRKVLRQLNRDGSYDRALTADELRVPLAVLLDLEHAGLVCPSGDRDGDVGLITRWQLTRFADAVMNPSRPFTPLAGEPSLLRTIRRYEI